MLEVKAKRSAPTVYTGFVESMATGVNVKKGSVSEAKQVFYASAAVIKKGACAMEVPK